MELLKVKKNLDYYIFFLALALTTFEYFFREQTLYYVFIVVVGILFLFKRKKYKKTYLPLVFGFFFIIYFLQGAYSSLYITAFNRFVPIIGAFMIAVLICNRFEKIFINTIAFIAFYSLVIYFLCYIPSIKSYLMYSLAPRFPSMNVAAAVFDGGGLNFIIYNFQSDIISNIIGFNRNCGPFWEPGMFAVYLNMALFLNIFLGENNKKLNILFIVAIITTFSTGGFVAMLYISMLYAFSKNKNTFVKILAVGVFIVIGFYVISLEYVGDKIFTQLSDTSVGGDESRFAAIMTQIEMIKASPFLGGESIEQYAKSTKTLASGIILPLVVFGIPFGLIYYYLLSKSCILLFRSLNVSKVFGILFFVNILILSISQTILMSNIFIIILFVGLIKIKNRK